MRLAPAYPSQKRSRSSASKGNAMRKILFGAASAAVLTSVVAFAQPIETVTITGRLEEELPQELAETGVRVQVVPGTVIEDVGYNDIAQVLQSQVPGLFVAPKNGA